MISTQDYLWYVDAALDAMVAILGELGDEGANQRLDTPGANSPYAVVTHCLGVMEFWGGYAVAGRRIERDREAEFRAGGDVAGLVLRVRAAREQLVADLDDLEPAAPVRGALDEDDSSLPLGRTQGGAVIHLYEELAQHLGQLEVTRDVLLAARAR
ncbi:DinB family protein [Angustibacter luteus]|uniref:DinB family protein n=1 Tax=Angustibacter luteus TaxID=658456 RepID=A0ABW1JI57_9ACTN